MTYEMTYKRFKEIDLSDEFFNSLKKDYKEFEHLFRKKEDECAYILKIDHKIKGFLYLKIEHGVVDGINSALNFKKILNIEFIKIDSCDIKLGERFIKKAIDFSILNKTNYIYVTIPEEEGWLINLFKKYGFKYSSNDGKEILLLKDIEMVHKDIRCSYPKIDLSSDCYLLPMFRENHNRHFPDTLFRNECENIVDDISNTNSIEKLHLTKVNGVENLKHGDIVLVYRKSDALVPSEYRSIATNLCVVDEIRHNSTFDSLESYLNYCKGYDSYSDSELSFAYYHKDEYYTIKMTYNVAIEKRISRHDLVEDINLSNDAYWGFFKISREKLEEILELGEVRENYIRR